MKKDKQQKFYDEWGGVIIFGYAIAMFIGGMFIASVIS